jgi:hypothetical protein
MKLSKLYQIIKEEIENWFDDDQPSMADKYYQQNLGIKPEVKPQAQAEQPKVSGQLIGYLDKQWSQPLPQKVPVYKNPDTLTGFEPYVRGILTHNGDIYVALTEKGLHLNLIQLLGQLGILPQSAISNNYGQQLPEEFITLIRTANMNQFVQSTAYDEFPLYYQVMFDEANKKHPNIKFKELPTDSPLANRVFVDNSLD